MMRITCDLNDFSFNETLNKSKDELMYYSAQVCAIIREKLKGAKLLLNNTITKSAAFVVLEENLLEYVNNSLDAFKKSSSPIRQIIIKIPISPSNQNMTTLIYSDTAGGFSKRFFKDKKSIDYYADVLHSNNVSIKSQKTNQDLGGAGLALSQTSRFLHEHAGILTIDNTKQGARMHLTSPIHSPTKRKPSFNAFRRQDYQNLLVEEDLRRESYSVFY